MKKLMLWLSLVLAIGLSAQSAWGYSPENLFCYYAIDGGAWQSKQTFSQSSDGKTFTLTFPKAGKNAIFMIVADSEAGKKLPSTLGQSDWDILQGKNGNSAWVQYSFGSQAQDQQNEISNGQILTFQGGVLSVLKISTGGTHTISLTKNGMQGGNETLKFSYTTEGATPEDPGSVPSYVNMPLKPKDFDGGKKHYFLVGSRMGDWRLQPEWEFTVADGNKLKIDGARVMYTGRVEIGVVDSYVDYVYQRYTRWGAPTVQTMNLAERTLSNLTSRGSFDFYTSDKVETAKQADMFCAAENKNFDGGAILASKGAVATSVELTLDASGNPQSWSISIPDDSPAEAYSQVTNYITLSLVGDAVVNRGLADSKLTPTGSDTWESAWVQFGPQGQAYRDGRNNLIFQTVFQPLWLDAHPTLFQKVINDASGTYNFDFSSRNIVMKNVKRMSAEELANDPYAPLYKRFENDTDKRIGGGRNVNVKGYNYTENIKSYGAKGEEEARTCDNWRCYVVKDMWVSGEFKVWTGWGGGQKKHEGVQINDPENARWYYLNGGHGEENKSHDIAGYDITADGASATVYGTQRDVNGANFNIPELTYYKRVIVWAGDSDFDGSVIQLITELAGPNIKALRNPESGSEIDLIWNIPEEGLTEEELKWGLQSYEIMRYIYDADGNLVLKGSMGEKDITGKTVADVVPDQTKDQPGNEDLADKDLNSNTYKYKIILTFADGKKREAWSNDVTIYDASAPVIARSFQRMEDNDTKYSFDARLNVMISAAALSKEYDGVKTRDLIDGYLIRVGETTMTDLNSSKLYINGVESDKKFENTVGRDVWMGGIKRTLGGCFMEIPFNAAGIPALEGEDPSRREFKWENVAKQEPGADYAFEIYIIPNETYIAQFASAQFEQTNTHFLMVIPNAKLTWTDKGIAARDFDGNTPAEAMPMGTHCGTDLYAPINYTKTNYLYAKADLAELPVTQSVRDGFDITVLAGTDPALTDAQAINTTDGLTLNDIDFSHLTTTSPDFPCERELVIYNGGAAVVNATAYAKADYVRRSDNRKVTMPNVTITTPIAVSGLEKPEFTAENMRINGHFMTTADNTRYSVHNLYMNLHLDGASALALTDGLFHTAGYYVAADASDFSTPAELITDAKNLKGGMVAHATNRDGLAIDELAGYEPYIANTVFDQKHNWAEKSVDSGHLPLIVHGYAAKQGDKEMTPAEMPAAKVTVTNHYPFMSGNKMLTLTEGTTKTVSLADVTVPTAIDGINADTDHTQAAWYNLQGIRVTNPVKGQVYLKVTPSGVEKTMF